MTLEEQETILCYKPLFASKLQENDENIWCKQKHELFIFPGAW